jgi:hypothetical protein
MLLFKKIISFFTEKSIFTNNINKPQQHPIGDSNLKKKEKKPHIIQKDECTKVKVE